MIINNETQLKILQSVWLREKTTMLELSEQLNIDRSNISRNLKHLKKSGLIYYNSEKVRTNSVGRKSFQIKFNYDFAYTIGIAVTENFILGFLMNLNFKVIKKEKIYKRVNEKTIVDDLIHCINLFSAYSNKILFIAISFPEPVDHEEGVILSSGIFPIHDLALKSILEEKTNNLVHLENDANAGAIYHFLKNKGIYKNIEFMFLSFYINDETIDGIQGNGIIVNGDLYKGAHSFSGELPLKIKIIDQDKNDILDFLKFEKFINDRNNFYILESYINWYSKISSLIINFLDPELFVIGGHTDILPNIVLKKMSYKIEERIIDNVRRKIKIEIDDGGIESIAKGSAMSFMNKIMNNLELVNKAFKRIN